MSVEHRTDIVDRLFFIMKNDSGVFASRASVSVGGFLRPDDAARIVPFLDHDNDTVKNNALVNLFKIIGLDAIEDFTRSAAREGLISAEAQTYVRGKISKILRLKEAGMPLDWPHMALNGLGMLYEYIPNLNRKTPG